ncbi:hypothetical protein NESM_000605200 [Novymonas esmeraldas]|uniref:Uncharacterized protein n=1 Tax=Novymonas esmeraldas TaxID=1808958 RepID=A0AAW0EU41_9TRYP
MTSNPSDELARLREELEREETDLAALEDDVEAHAAQLGCLHTEYTLNKARLCHHYEPRLQPLRVITYAAAQKESLLSLQIEWLERRVVEQERRSQGGQFVEMRDMKPAAEEYVKTAYQSLLRCYEHISECPEDALHVVSHYACPPDEAIATMELVMKVRGEDPADCTWTASQVLLSYTYFHDFFVTRSESLLKRSEVLSDVLMSELEGFCANPHHSVQALYRISTPIGCMGEWLHCIRNYYRVKLVTAPVLLSRNADTRRITEQAQAWLNMITLGKQQQPSQQQQQEQSAGSDAASPSTSSPSQAAPLADTVEAEDDAEGAELGALISTYHTSKANLQITAQPAEVTADTVQQLRHRLHRIREGVRTAEDERRAIESELEAKLAEVRGNYDDTMVPLEDQLEETTECFVQRISRKGNTAAIAAVGGGGAEECAVVAA